MTDEEHSALLARVAALEGKVVAQQVLLAGLILGLRREGQDEFLGMLRRVVNTFDERITRSTEFGTSLHQMLPPGYEVSLRELREVYADHFSGTIADAFITADVLDRIIGLLSHGDTPSED